MARAADLRSLGQKLRTLAELPVAHSKDLTNWYNQANELRMHIVGNGELADCVPHFVWHYLSDADIRFKEPEYAKRQQEAIVDIVRVLERGQVPIDSK